MVSTLVMGDGTYASRINRPRMNNKVVLLNLVFIFSIHFLSDGKWLLMFFECRWIPPSKKTNNAIRMTILDLMDGMVIDSKISTSQKIIHWVFNWRKVASLRLKFLQQSSSIKIRSWLPWITDYQNNVLNRMDN